ncbi:sialate O-acetylesterase [Sulfuriroseicoccus oceanibius]|uniref:SGNH hydrolase-type esterase domain-containing protein n=1 Tax=Sulfuriroseicoccus oceanibius TaxID=2707525 RepID=A0A6B3LDG8_9BACT|nr:sialate O-acetylesterase [Sulfuriroseicoccus oceanibius]QQL44940.1 hypothetical protein G3M56_013900 [Sulfuriroseicoccus oceanibius]
MNRISRILALTACTTLAAPLTSAYAEHYKLFVLTGQSNSLGTTNGGESDPSSGSDPADSHIKFAWRNVQNATTTIGHSGQTLDPATTTADFTTLQDQQGGVYGGSATHWGPEISFGRNLFKAGVRNFGIIKASRGGGGNTFWDKSAGGHMYTDVVDTVTEATADLTADGHTFEIVGLLYFQGESNTAAEASVAGSRFKTLVDNLRSDLPNAASLHGLIGGIAKSGSEEDTTRAQHAAIAASTSYISYFDNVDQTANYSPDGLHFNKQGKLTIGQRFANAAFDAGIVSRHYGRLVFIGDSITQGGNGDHPSYRYQVFKNLANANVPADAATGYQFVGSVTGAHTTASGGGNVTTPDVNGQSFSNVHEGHYGWRVSWEVGRVALPAGRRSGNRGEGTLLNWTGQANPQEYDLDSIGNKVPYPDPAASDTGNTGTTYTPDTAVIKIGINDIADGVAVTQIRDDIGTMIDQLQAANANVRIFLSQVLYINKGAALNAKVDELNALLPSLAADKTTSTSPIWVIETNTGFNPVTQTFDQVHPNADGEAYVGNRISGGLALIEMPVPGGVTALPLQEKDSNDLGSAKFEGTDIWNTGSFATGWISNGNPGATAADDNDIRITHPGDAIAHWIEGTNTGWSDINDGIWTWEARFKFDALPNGFIVWLGTGEDAIFIELYADRTQDTGGQSFNVAHNNTDGQFHTFRVTHDPNTNRYHVWRDDVQLTPAGGAPYDGPTDDERMILGDFTGSSFGDGYSVTVDYVMYRGGYEGNEIHNGTSFINSWTNAQNALTATIVNSTDLQLVNPGSGPAWLEGENTDWATKNDSYWTWESRIKCDNVANGFIIWLETGAKAIQVALFPDRTEDLGANSFSISHNNVDGEFHTFRIGYDAAREVYHVWRDGERLTNTQGATPDANVLTQRMILGDYTTGPFGNNFDVTIDYIRTDSGNSYLPLTADADKDGLPDLWEDRYYGSLTGASATADDDADGRNNLDEYTADTNPTDSNSTLTVTSTVNSAEGTWNLTVPKSSTARRYTLKKSVDLGIADPWAAVPGQGPITGNGSNLVFQDTPTGNRTFYKVEVSHP